MEDFSFNLIHCVVFLFGKLRHRIRSNCLVCDLRAIATYNLVGNLPVFWGDLSTLFSG